MADTSSWVRGLKGLLLASAAVAVLTGSGFGSGSCGSSSDGLSGGAPPEGEGEGGAGAGGAGEEAWAAACEAEAAKWTECGAAQDPGDLEECKAGAPCNAALFKPEFIEALRACFEEASCEADNLEDGCYASAADKTPASPATTDAQTKCDAKVVECGVTFKDDFCADMHALNDDVAADIAECTSQPCEEASACAGDVLSAVRAPCGGK